MNIYSAIMNLRDGQAVKPSNWRGYVMRRDEDSYQEFSALGTYEAGDEVVYNGYRYVCSSPVTTPGPFDSAKWNRVDKDYYIAFVDAEDTTSGESPATPNPSAVYKATVDVSGGGVTWSRLGTSAEWPGGTTPSTAPVDMPDSDLFRSLLADTWETGSSDDYEIQRSGGGGRW